MQRQSARLRPQLKLCFRSSDSSYMKQHWLNANERLQPGAVPYDYESVNAYFSTTMERLRIERLIPCDRNARLRILRGASARTGQVRGRGTAQAFPSPARFISQDGQPSETAARR